MPNPYQSGELSINRNLNNHSHFQAAATVFGDNIMLLTTYGAGDEHTNFVINTFPLSKVLSPNPDSADEPINDAAFKDPNSWTSAEIDRNDAAGIKPSFASSTDTLFAFYYKLDPPPITPPILHGPSTLLALPYPLKDDLQPGNIKQWGQPIYLYGKDGVHGPTPAYGNGDSQVDPINTAQNVGIDTTTIGENIVIVACASAAPVAVNQGSYASDYPTATGTFIGVYDTNKVDIANNKWVAEYDCYIPCAGDFKQKDLIRVMVEWYSALGNTKDANGNIIPEYYLLVAAMDKTNGVATAPYLNAFTFKMPVILDGKGNISSLGAAVQQQISFDNNAVPETPFYWSDLNRDAAGRLKSWFCCGSNRQQFVCYNAVVQDATNSIVFTVTKNVINSTVQTNWDPGPLASLVYIASNGVYSTTEKLTNQDGTITEITAKNYPVYEFVFCGYYPQVHINRVGTIQTFTDPDSSPRTLTQKDQDKPVYIIGGIFNGPTPFPIDNYDRTTKPTSELDAGSIVYGSLTEHINSKKTQSTLLAGFKAEGKTTEGIGPAFDISFKAGAGSVQENSIENDYVSDIIQHAHLSFENGLLYADPNAVIKVVSAIMRLTAFNYIDYYGASIDSTSASGSPASGSIQLGLTDNGGGAGILEFIPYNVTPGDLFSYTAGEINNKMNSLGYKGSDYGYNYEGNNYFSDMICRNALPIGQDTVYLEITWADNGAALKGRSQKATSYQENSYQLDVDAYAGFGGGGGFSLFGLGGEFEFSLMAGINFSRENSTSDENAVEWGISLEPSWGPNKSDSETEGVKSYVFRIYFLPVPEGEQALQHVTKAHWTEELLKYLPADSPVRSQVDKNSCCWQICYVVTNITYNDPNKPAYNHNTKLDIGSYYSG